ncbi:MAG: hypothetical protein J6W27_02090 [Alphaproteobacteria bacterium]|nr:hypothetical protein [Alphaproteobacteria bacterium]
MKKVKRLFIFAGYDKDNIIDDTLVWYLNALSKLGDIVLIMDCDVQDTSKLESVKNILHIETKRHGEYDFGSYKRGYMWAQSNNLLDKYDWIYLVNDSVYGPLFDLEPCLNNLESKGTDLTGLTSYYDEFTPVHIQSWFVGLSHNIATSNVLYNFMQDVGPRKNKWEIITKYEVGLSRHLLQSGYKMSSMFTESERYHTVYQKPRIILENLIPFIKKAGLENIGGTLYLLPYTSDEFIKMIFEHAKRTGIKYPQNEADISVPVKIYRLSLLSIPICTIYKTPKMKSHPDVYTVYLFDKIRILKIIKNNIA